MAPVLDFDPELWSLTLVGVTTVPGWTTVVTDTIVVNVCPFEVNLQKVHVSATHKNEVLRI